MTLRRLPQESKPTTVKAPGQSLIRGTLTETVASRTGAVWGLLSASINEPKGTRASGRSFDWNDLVARHPLCVRRVRVLRAAEQEAGRSHQEGVQSDSGRGGSAAASQGHKYNSVGGLKGVHAWTTVLTVVFVLPLWIVSVCLETVYDGAKQGSAEGKPRRR